MWFLFRLGDRKKRNLPPAFVVGAEGVFGLLVMTAIVLPVVSVLPGTDGDGVREDAIDAAYQFGSNGKLAALVLGYWLSIAFYNSFSLAIAKNLSSVHRTLIDACRTVLVWGLDVMLYYTSKHKVGEAWHTEFGLLQFLGFLLLVFGSTVYYDIVRLPCFARPPPKAVE